MLVVHTREGHRPDLSDCPPAKLARGRLDDRDRRPGPEGPDPRPRRGGPRHRRRARARCPGEVVLDKPGKGSFYATDLELLLRNRGITHLLVTGVTTEVCVHTTVREANDRGFECLVLADCVGSYFPEFHEMGLRMIAAQGGIFGWVAAVRGAARPRSARTSTSPSSSPGASDDLDLSRSGPAATSTPSSASGSTCSSTSWSSPGCRPASWGSRPTTSTRRSCPRSASGCSSATSSTSCSRGSWRAARAART